MSYLYDVFISYKRGRINEQWLTDIFLPFFQSYLDDELPEAAKIFVDRTGLTPGVDFRNELFNNLIRSKCLVSIWSPSYFSRSEWCVKEFLTMQYKAEHHRLGVNTLPKTLVWPILYRKIPSLPLVLKNISYLDYSEYNVVGEAFLKSDLAFKFQKQLQGDISTLSDIIKNVPEFNFDFTTDESKSKLLQQLLSYLENNSDLDNPKQALIRW